VEEERFVSLNENAVKNVARKLGADLVGIASAAPFMEAPRDYQPTRVLPDTVSVVVIGVRILRGVTMTQKSQVAYLPFALFGHAWLSNIRLNLIAHDVSRFIEDFGYDAVPVPWPCEERTLERRSRSGEIMSELWPVESFVSFKHAAVAAGLGEFGLHRLLMTPEFGPRQRLVVVITNAPLEPDNLFEGHICDPEECGHRCILACPTQALKKETRVTFSVASRRFEVADFDELRCSYALSGLLKETCKFAPMDLPVPDVIAADDLIALKKAFRSLDSTYKRIADVSTSGTGSCFCSLCLVACAEYHSEWAQVQGLHDSISGDKGERESSSEIGLT